MSNSHCTVQYARTQTVFSDRIGAGGSPSLSPHFLLTSFSLSPHILLNFSPISPHFQTIAYFFCRLMFHSYSGGLSPIGQPPGRRPPIGGGPLEPWLPGPPGSLAAPATQISYVALGDGRTDILTSKANFRPKRSKQALVGSYRGRQSSVNRRPRSVNRLD